MANAEFAQRYGVPAPGRPKGNYPVTIAELVQGGLQVVPNESSLLLIKPQFRETGMEVNVLSTQKKYRLMNNPDTERTQFSDWKYIPDGIDLAYLNLLFNQDGLLASLDELVENLKNYLTKIEARETYFDKDTIMRYYQTIENMKYYVTQEEFERVMIALSKLVIRILPFNIIYTTKETPITSIDLPTNAIAIYGDGKTESVPVEWITDPYNPNLIGYQILEGRIILPDYIDTSFYPNITKCHLIIYVQGETELPTMSSTIKGGAKNGSGLVMGGEDNDIVSVDLTTAVERQDIPVYNASTNETTIQVQTSIGKIILGSNLELNGNILNCTGGGGTGTVEIQYEEFDQNDIDEMMSND